MTSRMAELQDAMNRYGEASVRNFETIHSIGEMVIAGFDAYLGVPGSVFGVPPTGEWEGKGVEDYHGARFSTYRHGRTLAVAPITMGLAVSIPHTKDNGAFTMRVVLEFAIEGRTFSVRVGDGRTLGGVAIDCSEVDLKPLYDEIFAYAKDILVNPVRSFEAEKTGKIGFLSP